jgi:nicotinamide phosphoribosyltransferase
MGTDTVEALLFARRYYGAGIAGFSVPAMEHSTVTSWTREGEVDSYRNMVKKNGKPGGIVSAVSDSYDIYEACHLWGTELKQDILDSGATLVVRPDSGHPASVVHDCMCILAEYFGYTTNEKGYDVLNNVRILQGDGINIESIKEILEVLEASNFSADNVVFGQGGALLQIVNRDDQKFAMKASAICVNGEWRDVFKDPITDPGKRSKKGRLKLIRTEDGTLTTTRDTKAMSYPDQLKSVFIDGNTSLDQTFAEIRERAQI